MDKNETSKIRYLSHDLTVEEYQYEFSSACAFKLMFLTDIRKANQKVNL